MGGVRQSRANGDALLQICRGTAPVGFPIGRGFVAAAQRHRLAPLAHVLLSRARHEEAFLLRHDFLNAVGSHVRNLAALRLVRAALTDVPWALLKGAALSDLAHPVPGVRPYADIDVLVKPSAFAPAIERLMAGGWTVLDRHHRLVLDRFPGEIHLLGPFGAQVDLHWSLINTPRVRSAFALPSAELLERTVVHSIATLDVPVLDDHDFLLHLCLHAAQSGADILLWLLDVDQWIRRFPPDWDVFVGRVTAARASAAAAIVLGRAVRAMRTPIPEEVLASMGAGVWRRVDRVVAMGQPVQGLTRHRSIPRLLARASRDQTTDSAEELARKMSSALRHRSPSMSAWEDAPDALSWQVFLNRVALQDGAVLHP